MTHRDPYIRKFESCLQPLRTPFDRLGDKDQGAVFIYMTNSKTWSLLLDPGNLAQIQKEAQEKIPIGYTQLWLFEKRYCVPLPSGTPETASDERPRKLEVQTKTRLKRSAWEGKLYVALREP